MKKILNYIILVFSTLLILLSCNNKKQHDNIYGIWFSYSVVDKEYSEFDIDKNNIGVYSHYGGNLGMLNYKLINDTLIYKDSKFKLNMISENQFVLISEERFDTLTRLPDSVITYNSITPMNDSIFKIFYGDFEQRAFNSWIKYGYVTKKELQESLNDTTEIIEEIILIDNEK